MEKVEVLLMGRSRVGSEGSANFCAVALDYYSIPNPAQKRVCGNAEPKSWGRKRLGTIARNAGERRAGDGLSCLAPARTAQSRKTRSLAPAQFAGERAGGEGATDSHALSNTWESVPNLILRSGRCF
jgi:hypothetical protein